MEKRKPYKLYDLAVWINGMAFRDINFSSKGLPVIKIAEIKNGISGQTKFTDSEYDSKYLVVNGDMLFCWSGQPETSIGTYWWRGNEGWLNQHIFKVLPKEDFVRRDYFYYVLQSLNPRFIQIARNKQTTGLGHVTKKDLESIEVEIPRPNEQKEIAKILSSFDDKIELNRQMNATLEAIARALFKAWFVDFEPVRANAENRPSESASPEIVKLFPSEFENGIPKGWRTGTLKDCCMRVESGGTPSRKVEKYWTDGTIAWLTSSEVRKPIVLDAKEYISVGGYENSNAKLWNKGTTVVAMYGATAGEVCLLANEMTANQACCGLIPKEGFCSFLFIKTFQSKQELANKSSGSAQQNLNQSIVANFQTIVPSENCVKAFEQIAGKLFDKWIENEKENRELAQIRDSLLPRLISGKIPVAGLESMEGETE